MSDWSRRRKPSRRRRCPGCSATAWASLSFAPVARTMRRPSAFASRRTETTGSRYGRAVASKSQLAASFALSAALPASIQPGSRRSSSGRWRAVRNRVSQRRSLRINVPSRSTNIVLSVFGDLASNTRISGAPSKGSVTMPRSGPKRFRPREYYGPTLGRSPKKSRTWLIKCKDRGSPRPWVIGRRTEAAPVGVGRLSG